MITFNKKVASVEDATIKYIFDVDGQMVEFSYIDNGTDKDIICVPCQTMCNMKCTFCHLTDHIGKIPTKDMDYKDIADGIESIIGDLSLGSRTILISYMGCGDSQLVKLCSDDFDLYEIDPQSVEKAFVPRIKLR
jgi:adenine C2-methylase RlmN of 23S rRNA A2503 and tRNA A37